MNILINQIFYSKKKKKIKSNIELHCFLCFKRRPILDLHIKKVIHINLIYNKTFGYGEDWCLVFAMI